MPTLIAIKGKPEVTDEIVSELSQVADRMLSAMQLADYELSVVLCDDPFIRELNRNYRGFDKPTDVLAFPQQDWVEQQGLLLGDVVISVPTARAQAREQGVGDRHELQFLLAHGVLHLLGFDHRDQHESRRMDAMTHVLLAVGASV